MIYSLGPLEKNNGFYTTCDTEVADDLNKYLSRPKQIWLGT